MRRDVYCPCNTGVTVSEAIVTTENYLTFDSEFFSFTRC